jgi:hypothetical protein
MINRLDLRIVIKIFDAACLSHQFETFDIQAGGGFKIASIMNSHFLHREVAVVFGFITATSGGNVDERFVDIGQKFQARTYRRSMHDALALIAGYCSTGPTLPISRTPGCLR